MRRIELGYGMSITGELAGTVALVVYALGAGGAALVAAYAASRTVAGMAVALVLTGITSRLPGCRDSVAAPAHRPRYAETRWPGPRSRGTRRHRRPGRVPADGSARRRRDPGVRPDIAPRRARRPDRRARRPRPRSGRVRGWLAHRCLRRGWSGRQ